MYRKKDSQHVYQSDIYQPVLVQLEKRLNELGLCGIKHQRLSIESIEVDNHIFQGLTYATKKNKPLMVKWELLEGKNKSVIQAEINALKQTQKAQVIPIILYDKSFIQFDNPNWQLALFAMPYIENSDVKTYLNKQNSKANRIDIYIKKHLILAMAQSLNSLHQIGWIHGDIKPSNFLITSFEQEVDTSDNKISTVLCDLSHAALINNTNNNSTDTANISQTTKGTPSYLAPECWRGKPMSIQSDIYAFGVTMFEILTGQKPYQVKNIQDYQGSELATLWTKAHCQMPIPYLQDKDYLVYQPIINKLLAKRLENRYTTMQQVCNDLTQIS